MGKKTSLGGTIYFAGDGTYENLCISMNKKQYVTNSPQVEQRLPKISFLQAAEVWTLSNEVETYLSKGLWVWDVRVEKGDEVQQQRPRGTEGISSSAM